MSPPGRRRRQLRLGTEVVGRKGVLLLVLGAVLAAILAVVGAHDEHFAGLSSSLATPSGSSGAPHQGPGGPTPAAAPPTTPPTTAPPHPATTAPSSSSPSSSPPPTAKLGPALSSTPYASVAFEVYPGTPSPATRQALAGFQVSVARHGTSIEVKVSVSGSSQPPIRKSYAASDKVYFIEASLGDDSGNSELNLGDDGIVVTNAQGRILQ